MEVRRSRLGLALVQGVLLALCAASALVFAAWLLGYNGLGLVDGAVMSDRLEQTNVVMNEPVLVQGRAGVATVVAASRVIGGMPTGEVRPATGPPSSTATRRTWTSGRRPGPSTPPGWPCEPCPRPGSR